MVKARGLKFGTQIAINQYYLRCKPKGKAMEDGGTGKVFPSPSISYRQ